MRFLIVAALTIAASVSQTASAADLVGRARVIDGDTLHIAGHRIRLFGIDAPESRQRCWASGVRYNCADQAKAALTHLTRDKDVQCKPQNYDQYGQVVAVCYVGTLDINREMVRQGWALAYRQYSGNYIDDEAYAERRTAGLWLGEFQKPWDWRGEGQ